MELVDMNLGDFGKPFVMPEKQLGDHDPIITALDQGYFVIRCGEQTITLSRYNAARIVAGLALFLNIKFSPHTARKLTL